ncbi:hypothetical protein [Pseudomonas aeruginosa]|uniref:hypothetical protein n=1 Tax=Pseudomonas aeruginosa TaxID=287 RepID=UPI002F3FBE8F
MSSTQHQLIKQCATRLLGIVEALDNIHDTSPHRWSTDLDDVHSSAESLLAMIKDQAPTQAAQDPALRTIAEYPCPEQDNMTAANMRQVAADAITGALAFGAQASQPPAEDHWLRPFYDIGRAEGQRTQELAMLVRMLASALKRHAPDSNLVARATNYLAAKGLAGTPFRDSSASVEQAGGDEGAAFFKHLIGRHPAHETEIVRVVEHNHAAWKAWQARAALAQPSPAPVCTTPTGENCPGDGVKSCKKCPEQAEAEAERPEVVDFNPYRYHAEKIRQRADGAASAYEAGRSALGYMEDIAESALIVRNGLDELSAQHERIVGALRFERQQMDRAFTACINERDAALARVAELERKLRDEENAHTTTIEQRDNAEHWADQLAKAIAERFGVDIGEHSNLNCPWNEALVWMQQPPAQAQHSVPEGWRIERSAERIVVMNLNNGAGYAAARNGESGIAESVLYLLAADLLAAAPGKEGL